MSAIQTAAVSARHAEIVRQALCTMRAQLGVTDVCLKAEIGSGFVSATDQVVRPRTLQRRHKQSVQATPPIVADAISRQGIISHQLLRLSKKMKLGQCEISFVANGKPERFIAWNNGNGIALQSA